MLIRGELCITHAYCSALTVERQLFDYARTGEAAGAQRLEITAGGERGAGLNPGRENQIRAARSALLCVQGALE